MFKGKFILTSFFLMLVLGFRLQAQEHEGAAIEWITYDEAVKRSQKEPRKILVDMYTDWCGWCKKMDRDTYENAGIAAYINENYYAVKFNAEQQEDVIYKGKTLKFVPGGRRGVHQFAAILMNNKMSYPTTVFLNEDHHVIQSIPGYFDAKVMEPILSYFGEDAFRKTPWPDYQKNFKSSL